MSAGFPFAHRLQVPVRDCDGMGHVNHAVYFTYMEQCRFALWRQVSDSTVLTGLTGLPGAGTIVAHAECYYLAPAYVNDVLEVRVNVGDIGRSSFVLLYEIANTATGQHLARGKTVIVTFDYQVSRPMPIPAETRRLLEKIRDQDGAPP